MSVRTPLNKPQILLRPRPPGPSDSSWSLSSVVGVPHLSGFGPRSGGTSSRADDGSTHIPDGRPESCERVHLFPSESVTGHGTPVEPPLRVRAVGRTSTNLFSLPLIHRVSRTGLPQNTQYPRETMDSLTTTMWLRICVTVSWSGSEPVGLWKVLVFRSSTSIRR